MSQIFLRSQRQTFSLKNFCYLPKKQNQDPSPQWAEPSQLYHKFKTTSKTSRRRINPMGPRSAAPGPGALSSS